MTVKTVKRGYVKWTDHNGVRHKVKETDYKPEDELPFNEEEDDNDSNTSGDE